MLMLITTVFAYLFQPHPYRQILTTIPSERQRKWFKLDEAIAELVVHRPDQCNYVRLLYKRTTDPNGENSSPTSSSETAHVNPSAGAPAPTKSPTGHDIASQKPVEDLHSR